MVTTGIPSARRKLERAQIHADALRTAIDLFREQSPYEFEMKSLGNPRGRPDFRVIVKVTEAPAVPDSWPLIMGDILTNVRAALDHAIFPHVRDRAPDVKPRRIQYPILDSAEAFEQRVGTWFSGDVRRIVEDSQPYVSDNPNGHPLRILRELVNIDKHRSLILTNYSVGDFQIAPNDLFETVSPPTVRKTPMVTGAVVARAHLRLVRKVSGDQWMHFPCNVGYGETIEIPGIAEPAGLLQAAEGITKAIGPHLDNLEEAGC
ncbi:hypothetical protein [Mycolicibacter algericus]|uniref:Uncharacterized protein n=2 Tax=Mycolicibacter algericus TaxID=1288388 RepID=A0A7I9Y6N7_MYCAL|nr:hypothetical protein [Mycolicibacter algericus]OQZ94644.1 hypothetical protein BST10_18015 [Mycolicibacter algericus DSM 45454]GFG84321.1 hypothetical protein MALGJ_09970 [Mycolicibacter algericus]